jgi:hypothetical protein
MQDELLAAVVQICHEEEEPRWGGGGLVLGRQIIRQDRFNGHHRLHADYFADDPVFGDDLFR